MIPKKIHYCWIGGGEMSETVRGCIESWRRELPDYEIVRHDESNYDIANAPVFVQEAYRAKRWAFATDYIRCKVLYEEGGIYLDTDVEVRKRLDEFLCYSFIIGTQVFPVEVSYKKEVLQTNLSIGVIGSEAEHPYLKRCMDWFETAHFIRADGSVDTTVSNYAMAEILKSYGFENRDERQSLSMGIEVYPSSVFGDRLHPENTGDCYTYHWGEMSWFEERKRGVLWRMCRRMNLMGLYRNIERWRGTRR